MSPQTEKLAVLFADICGSTALYDSLGDTVARRLISRCITLMSGEADAHQGTLIKTIGDEIMCTFPTAETALQAACAMQRAVENSVHENNQEMHIRIGLHYGEVIHEAADIFGDTVNVAARVAAITRASQIMTTQAVIDLLPPELCEKTRRLMRAEFKGKQKQFDIFLVIWEMDEMLSTRIGTPSYRKPSAKIDELLLKYKGKTLSINAQRLSVIIGRADTCDVIVHSDFASRQHLRIEFRFGKFVLVDQSTNGTYLRFNNGTTARLAREEMVLHGSGSISLGQLLSDNPDEHIEFSIHASHLPH